MWTSDRSSWSVLAMWVAAKSAVERIGPHLYSDWVPLRTYSHSHSPCVYSSFQVLHSSGQSLGSSWDVILNVIKAAAALTRWGRRSSAVHTCTHITGELPWSEYVWLLWMSCKITSVVSKATEKFFNLLTHMCRPLYLKHHTGVCMHTQFLCINNEMG